jgi:hypothetical protein
MNLIFLKIKNTFKKQLEKLFKKLTKKQMHPNF